MLNVCSLQVATMGVVAFGRSGPTSRCSGRFTRHLLCCRKARVASNAAKLRRYVNKEDKWGHTA